MTKKAGEIDREAYRRKEWLGLLEESRDLNLETFKTYTYGYTYGVRDERDESYTISVIRGRSNGRRVRINYLHTKTGNGREEDQNIGFEFEKDMQMSQEEAERIFSRYNPVLMYRNQQEGIRRSTLAGQHPLKYWQEITQPMPTNKRRAIKFHS